jgi:hypothetical protein
LTTVIKARDAFSVNNYFSSAFVLCIAAKFGNVISRFVFLMGDHIHKSVLLPFLASAPSSLQCSPCVCPFIAAIRLFQVAAASGAHATTAASSADTIDLNEWNNAGVGEAGYCC